MTRPALDVSMLHAILEHAPGAIAYIDKDGYFCYVNRDMPPFTVDALLGKHCIEAAPPDLRALFEDAMRIARESRSEHSVEYPIDTPDGQRYWFTTRSSPLFDDAGEFLGYVNITTDKTEQKSAEQELARLYDELLEASHRAGMAEVATGVLHNVGNVLNSVNVSAAALMEQVSSSHVDMLARTIELCEEQGEDLPSFFADDPKGRKLPALLSRLSEQLVAEHRAMCSEVKHLVEHVNIIRSTIEVQQSIARTDKVLEPVRPGELIDRALSMFRIDFDTKAIELVVDVQDAHSMRVDKQATLQILVNLIRNGIEALLDTEGPRTLEVKSHTSGELVYFEVIDNGCGIDADNKAKIFSHGFTTKPSGHGFGLHSSAIAARAMGGSLEVTSDGPGRGARFCLTLPRRADI